MCKFHNNLDTSFQYSDSNKIYLTILYPLAATYIHILAYLAFSAHQQRQVVVVIIIITDNNTILFVDV